jgi:hypothetical protein
MSHAPSDDLLALCERLIEGTLTADERARLERLVLDDPEARRTYVEYMRLHAALAGGTGHVAASTDTPPAAPAPKANGWSLRRRVAQVAVLGVALGLGAMVGLRWTGRPPAIVATLVEAEGCRWDESSVPTAEGARLPAGRLRLHEGLARLVFASGAQIALEGPAELELVSPMSCVLHRGSLVANVPPPAHGFTVRSAQATLIDHGTEFAVTADAAGRTRVQVQSGLVEARHPRGETLRLETGEGALLDAERVTRGRFAELPEPAIGAPGSAGSARGQVVLTTAMGRGAARSLQGREPPTDRVPGAGVLAVKNCADEAWQRKIWLTFDAGALAAQLVDRAITDVSLSLALVPTGYGHAAFVPTATFGVYGLTGSEAPDRFDWRSAPGNAAGGAAVDPSRTVRLGAFTVAQGRTSGVVTVGGAALTAFLRERRGGLVTLLVVRDTPELRTGGLVHGVAGDHHPEAPPPTLRITLEPRVASSPSPLKESR